jgi:hypothetical protein
MKALFFEETERLRRQQSPDTGLKLVGYIAAKDSVVKYFLAMLK